jgi:uncharacterized integral membrane protein
MYQNIKKAGLNSKKRHKKSSRNNKRFLFIILTILLLFLFIFAIFDSYVASTIDQFNPLKLILLTSISLGGIFIAYEKLYKDHEEIKQKIKKKKELEIKRKKEQAVNKVRQAVLNFRKAKTEEQVLVASEEIYNIALTYDFHRQGCVDLLYSKIAWMENFKTFFFKQNLNSAKIKREPFDQTAEFAVTAENQNIAMLIMVYLEKIIKYHCKEFSEQKTKLKLDLSSKFLPAFNFSSVYFSKNSVNFQYAILWQCTFTSATLEEINFSHADLTYSKFFKTNLIYPNFNGTKLLGCTFRTDLSKIPELTAGQLFHMKDWHLNLLSQEQIDKFFVDRSDKNQNWDQWLIGSIERKNFFGTLAKK